VIIRSSDIFDAELGPETKARAVGESNEGEEQSTKIKMEGQPSFWGILEAEPLGHGMTDRASRNGPKEIVFLLQTGRWPMATTSPVGGMNDANRARSGDSVA
jgi:hypothetical protein